MTAGKTKEQVLEIHLKQKRQLCVNFKLKKKIYFVKCFEFILVV
jgi:hypothetical protein